MGEESWGRINSELKELLFEDEYAEARASTLTAFYTPPAVVSGMHEVLRSLGFGLEAKGSSKADYILEPGCGTGNFMSVGDSNGFGYTYFGVELDRVSAQIAQVLHPQDVIVNASLDECYVSRDSFDAVMGNVPYSDAIKLTAPDGRRVPIHDFFIMESVDAMRPGGVAALLTSRFTMDKQDASTRRWIAQRAELIGAARLPSGTFRAQAGTDVISDVLILRKRDVPVESVEDLDWVRASTLMAPDGSRVSMNSFFADGSHVVGRLGLTLGRYGYTIDVTSDLPDEDIAAGMTADLLGQVLDLGDLHKQLGKRMELPLVAERPARMGGLYEFFGDESGNIWYGNGDVVEAVPLPDQDRIRMLAMVRLRDRARELMAYERSCQDDALVSRRIAELDEEYEGFVREHGRLCDARNKKLWNSCGADYSYQNVLSATEERDSSNRFVRKGDILVKRVQGADQRAPERINDPRDALMYSLDKTGFVDMKLICSLTGLDEGECIDRLGDAVVVDPADGAVLLADDYLSGDVLAKLDEVDGMIDDLVNGPVRESRSAWLESQGLSEIAQDIADKADFGVRDLLNEKRNGAWAAFCDPLSACVAVDTDAAFEAEGLNRWGRFTTGNAIALIDDLRPGCRLVDDGASSALWSAACRSVHRELRDDSATAVYLIREASLTPVEVVSDEAFRRMLIDSLIFNEDSYRRMFGELLPDGISVPTHIDARLAA